MRKRLSDFLFKIRHWETWHYLAKYIPLAPAWLWYCIRSGSVWFFSTSNPTLTFGGFEGENKKEMYDQLPPDSFPKTIYIEPSTSFDDLKRIVEQNGFQFPFAVKPNVGMMGFLFRKIRSIEDLEKYHSIVNVEYIIQEFVDHPLEVSVFYYRFPGEEKGKITGFIKKEFLEVVGDGKKTLWQLIQEYDRVRFRLDEMKAKHESRLDLVLRDGEIYCLSPALNLSRGGKLVSMEHEKNEQLTGIFDEISLYTKQFYYGRYDLKCSSIEELKQGKNFTILEFNGCGAEPHHIYGNGHSLLQAYRIVLHHWSVLSRISIMNYKSGIKYWDFHKGYQYLKKARKHFATMKALDASLEL